MNGYWFNSQTVSGTCSMHTSVLLHSWPPDLRSERWFFSVVSAWQDLTNAERRTRHGTNLP